MRNEYTVTIKTIHGWHIGIVASLCELILEDEPDYDSASAAEAIRILLNSMCIDENLKRGPSEYTNEWRSIAEYAHELANKLDGILAEIEEYRGKAQQ
jgi:hypothetical protein